MRYKTYSIQQGDNIQNVAQQFLGRVDLWTTIASYNGLKYPYISDEPGENIATIGDRIVIPIPDTNESLLDAPLNQQDRETITKYSLGIDLNLLSDTSTIETRGASDELVALSSDGRDLDVVSGDYNLIQAIIMRLNTPKGSLLLHPEYGNEFSFMIGENVTRANLRKLSAYLGSTIAEDPRVSSVEVVSSSTLGDVATFEIQVVPIGYEERVTIYTAMDSKGLFTLRGK